MKCKWHVNVDNKIVICIPSEVLLEKDWTSMQQQVKFAVRKGMNGWQQQCEEAV